MLHQISWLEYMAFMAVPALFYYAYMLFVYYRHDLLQLGKSKKSPQSPNQLSKPADPSSSQNVQLFTDEIKAYLAEAGNNGTSNDALLQCLSVIAGKYPSLAQSEYRESLDQFLINEAEMNCAVFLSDSEVRRIWSGT